MTKAASPRLPERFIWIEEMDRRRLFLENVEVLEVRPQLRGWVVQVHLDDPHQRHPIVVVRSSVEGMRWGARWSRQRAPQLAAMVAIRGRHETPDVAGNPAAHRE